MCRAGFRVSQFPGSASLCVLTLFFPPSRLCASSQGSGPLLETDRHFKQVQRCLLSRWSAWGRGRAGADAGRTFTDVETIAMHCERSLGKVAFGICCFCGRCHPAALSCTSSWFAGSTERELPSRSTVSVLGQVMGKLQSHWGLARPEPHLCPCHG